MLINLQIKTYFNYFVISIKKDIQRCLLHSFPCNNIISATKTQSMMVHIMIQ